MRYLFTTDNVEFVELDDLIINPGNAPIHRVPTTSGGILRQGRRESDRVSFTAGQLLPTGSDASIFESAGRIHFVLVRSVRTNLSSFSYDGVLMKTRELALEEIRQIR